MEKEIISATVASLPLSEIGEIQQDHEIWEEIDGGAKLMVTRHLLPTPNRDEIISLSVSGPPAERLRIVREFTQVFGAPFNLEQKVSVTDRVDVAIWINRSHDG